MYYSIYVQKDKKELTQLSYFILSYLFMPKKCSNNINKSEFHMILRSMLNAHARGAATLQLGGVCTSICTYSFIAR